jgi:hypothetical protein
VKIDAPDPAALLAEIGKGTFTLKGAGVHYPFSEFRYRAVGLTPDGKGIALEIVDDGTPE